MRAIGAAALLLASLTPSIAATEPSAPSHALRPNILWITAEDLSPRLGCYGDAYANTPNLDRMARESLRYTQAYATAPVCSPARSCLITGVYATSLGTQRLRSLFPIPDSIKGFPSYLRDAGYYCSNNVKTDYNTRNEAELIRSSWDECSTRAHWRNRKPGQPFFSVFNLMHTHQSRACVWSFDEFEEQIGSTLPSHSRHDPALAPLPPYYPDTPVVRRTMARFYDCITAMDREVGRILTELHEDGLADNTIVFFYGDHGDGLPRGKRTLYDSGMRVPLLVHFPGQFRSQAPVTPGQTTDRLVSFVDFAPTVLSLAGLPIPDYIQGRPFLGTAQQPAREYVYGARDRVDEAYDLSRSVRDRRFLYIRNYLPHLSLNQPEYYSDTADIRREITRLAESGNLNAAQLTYAGPGKPLEELYDTTVDPHQLTNLVASAAHQDALTRMRRMQRDWSRHTRDLGFLPESDAWARSAESTPFHIAQSNARYPLDRILAAADAVGRGEAISRQLERVQDPDPAVRYWAAIGLAFQLRHSNATPGQTALGSALNDNDPSVRIEAAAGLLQSAPNARAETVLREALHAEQLATVLPAVRHLELLGTRAKPLRPAMRDLLAKARANEGEDPLWMFIRFSLESALDERTQP